MIRKLIPHLPFYFYRCRYLLIMKFVSNNFFAGRRDRFLNNAARSRPLPPPLSLPPTSAFPPPPPLLAPRPVETCRAGGGWWWLAWFVAAGRQMVRVVLGNLRYWAVIFKDLWSCTVQCGQLLLVTIVICRFDLVRLRPPRPLRAGIIMDRKVTN